MRDLFSAMGIVTGAVLFLALIIPRGTPSVAQQEPEPPAPLPKARLRSDRDATSS